jgi:predicted Rossmann-fold nucleotide-binding protein
MGMDTSYNNISEVLSLSQKKHKQKMITHNGDNYANKFYNMIYLDDINKVNIKKNKVK